MRNVVAALLLAGVRIGAAHAQSFELVAGGLVVTPEGGLAWWTPILSSGTSILLSPFERLW